MPSGSLPGINNDQLPNMKGRSMELLSDRLVLRPWADADAPALFELARDPRVGIAAGWPPHESEEQSLDILRSRASTFFAAFFGVPSNTP